MESVSIILLVPGQLGVLHPLCLRVFPRQLLPGALIQMLVLEAFSQINFHSCLSADIDWQSGVMPQPMGGAGGKELPSELDSVGKERNTWKAASGHLQCWQLPAQWM